MTSELHTLSLDEFLTLAKTAKRVAVFREIPASDLTPLAVFKTLAIGGQNGVIFETGLDEGKPLSYLAFDPMATIEAKDGVMTQTIGKEVTTLQTNPFKQLSELIATFSCVTRNDMCERISKALGFITYDAVRYIESIPDPFKELKSLPDILFHFFRVTLLLDQPNQTLLVSIVVEIDDTPKQTYLAAQQEIAQLIDKIRSFSYERLHSKISSPPNPSPVEVDVTDETFMQLVDKAKEHIRQGDAFQIVLSRCFKQRLHVSPLAIYHTLRQVSRAPYLFYFTTADSIIVGASPETLVSVYHQQVTINPIAGTRRHSSAYSLEALTNELLEDKKELAEHMMLVDLARNDIGAVCEPGSIKVAELMKVKHFSHVSHITSTVTGRLRQHIDNLTALTSAFPAGTLSGAPKIRAMEIISELETSRRGLYGGGICRLDLNNNLDSCIAIRMAILKDGVATVRAGAGIVHDSNPAAEAQETRHKAQALLDTIASAEEIMT